MPVPGISGIPILRPWSNIRELFAVEGEKGTVQREKHPKQNKMCYHGISGCERERK